MTNARELYGMGPAPANNKAEFMTKAASFMDNLMSGARPSQPEAQPAAKTQDEKRAIVNGMLDKLASDKQAEQQKHEAGRAAMSKVLDDLFKK